MPLSLGAVITILVLSKPFYNRRSNTHYDSSREENSGNVRAAVRQRLYPPRPYAGAHRADVWVRYQRMRGHEVNFICADDAHGTPIMLKAQQLGITPEQMIGEMSQSTRPISPVLILATTTTTQRTATRIASCPS